MSNTSNIRVIKSKYGGADKDGDFGWMIRQPQYDRTLFLFNDNEGEFLAHHGGGTHNCGDGGGNAIIRPYQCRIPQRALGIPDSAQTWVGVLARGGEVLAHTYGDPDDTSWPLIAEAMRR